MPLSPDDAKRRAQDLVARLSAERESLDEVWRYLHGRQRLSGIIPAAAPPEVKRMARMARVNVSSIVVESLAQSLAVTGFRGQREAENAAVWDVWQRNRLDARQSGIHRAALAYGVGYAIVLPGDPVPVVRGVSPRLLATVYGDDPDWPEFALEKRPGAGYRLYDREAVYELAKDSLDHLATREHRVGVTPVVRFLEAEDLDREDPAGDDIAEPHPVFVQEGLTIPISSGGRRRPVAGQVGPLMDLQDQVDLITFNLLVAQHYTAFRQRYIIGWTAPDEATKAKAGASVLWTFDEDPEKVRIGEFSETNLDGYIKSREASLRHAASLSQTPAHELIGELVNLSAEALAAAEAGRDRKVADRQTMFGEAHEQMFGLVGRIAGIDVPDNAQVRWRDTSARAFAAVVDGLGKLATMLGVPPQELWERIPGVTQQDIERWKAAAAEGDSFAGLTDLLDRQAGDPGDIAAEMKAKAEAMGVLIRAGVTPQSAARQAGLGEIEFSGAVPVSLRFPESDAAALEGAG